MRIISKRKVEIKISYELEFRWKDDPHAGFSFSCDKNGNVNRTDLHPAGLANLDKCLSGEHDVESLGVREIKHRHEAGAVGVCDDCSRKVVLFYSINSCQCGADYNCFGQRLAPRGQWGEETGEHWTDIVHGS